MNSIEFETERQGGSTLALPREVAEQLPNSGRAKVLLLVEDDPQDRQWRLAAYEPFMKDGNSEDALYDEDQ